MSDERPGDDLPMDRESPVGEPVIRGDPSVTGQRATDAVEFDPRDPSSLERAAETVRAFATGTAGNGDNVAMLRGAAACAALVRGEDSYRAAADRAGSGVTVSFIRKWARVHDLPRPVRAYVARGEIAPSAAMHIARVSGSARLQLACATIDHDMTVETVRQVASDVADGTTVTDALSRHGIELGELTITLPEGVYCQLRAQVSLTDASADQLIADALVERFEPR
jgi:hypothetical protein